MRGRCCGGILHVGNDRMCCRGMGRRVPRTTPGLLPEQGFLRTRYSCRQGSKPENHFYLLPPEVLSLESDMTSKSVPIFVPMTEIGNSQTKQRRGFSPVR